MHFKGNSLAASTIITTVEWLDSIMQLDFTENACSMRIFAVVIVVELRESSRIGILE